MRARIGWLELACRLDFGHAPRDDVLVACRATKARVDKNPIVGQIAMAIGQAQLRKRQRPQRTRRIDGSRLDQHILEFAAIRPGVHAQPAADSAGNAREKFHAGDAGLARRQRDIEIERAGASDNIRAVDRDIGEAAAQPHHHARNAAIADQEIGGDADRRHRHIGGLGGDERGKVLRVGRAKQHLGRAADAEPGQRRQRRVLGDAAPYRRQAIEQAIALFARRHHATAPEASRRAAATASSSAGKACAQLVIEPAPRQTTKSPAVARS